MADRDPREALKTSVEHGDGPHAHVVLEARSLHGRFRFPPKPRGLVEELVGVPGRRHRCPDPQDVLIGLARRLRGSHDNAVLIGQVQVHVIPAGEIAQQEVEGCRAVARGHRHAVAGGGRVEWVVLVDRHGVAEDLDRVEVQRSGRRHGVVPFQDHA